MDFCLLTGKKKGVTGLLSKLKRCMVLPWWPCRSMSSDDMAALVVQTYAVDSSRPQGRCPVPTAPTDRETENLSQWPMDFANSFHRFLWITVTIISSPSKFVEGHVERIPLPNYFLAVISPERHEVLIVSRASLRLENLSNLLIFKSNNPNSKWQSL